MRGQPGSVAKHRKAEDEGPHRHAIIDEALDASAERLDRLGDDTAVAPCTEDENRRGGHSRSIWTG